MLKNDNCFEKFENAMYLALVALTIRKKNFTDAIKLSLKRGNSVKISKNKASIEVIINRTEGSLKNLDSLVNDVAVQMPRSIKGDSNEKAEITASGYKFSFCIIKKENNQKFIRLEIIPDG